MLRRFDITAVMHFAAHAYVGESMIRPRVYFQNNVSATLLLLEALLDTNVNLLVFSSSCATFGVPVQLPILDEHPQWPVNPYGESKLFCERALRWYDHAYGLRSVSLRYFNAAGADPDGELGEDHDPETHLVPSVIAAARGERSHIELLGTDYDTPDGTAIRDYVHVADLAEAHVRALSYLLEGGPTDAFNLGAGRGHSVLDVIRTVEAASGRRVPVTNAPRRAGDPPALIASSERAGVALGWIPRSSELRTIVETAWRWHASHSAYVRRDPSLARKARRRAG
jgi:UDP-glucose-4-epimerase GalE